MNAMLTFLHHYSLLMSLSLPTDGNSEMMLQIVNAYLYVVVLCVWSGGDV